MYQRFLFFGGSKHGERISVREQDTNFLVTLHEKALVNEDDCGICSDEEKEIYYKQEWCIDEKTEFVFVFSSLVEGQSENEYDIK